MDPVGTTGAVATAGVTAGAGTPPANAGKESGSPTGSEQTAGGASASQNQQTGNAGAGQLPSGQMVPLTVVTQLREKNRQLEAMFNEARSQNAAILERLQMASPGAASVVRAASGDDGVAEADRVILDALERRIEAKFGPVLQRFGTATEILERQERQAQVERGRKAREAIAEQYPIFKHKLLGAGAAAELQQKLATYEMQRVRVDPMEVAEEVAAVWNQRKQEYDAEVAGSLVNDARRAAPGPGTGAAVASGTASGPVTPPGGSEFVGLRAKSEQFKQELLRRRAAGIGAA